MLSQEIDSFIVLWDTDILNICVKLNGFIGPYQIWLRNGSIISSPPPPPSCWDPHCSWRSPLHSGGLGCNWEDRMWDDPLQGDGIIVDSRYSPLFLSSAILSPFRSKLHGLLQGGIRYSTLVICHYSPGGNVRGVRMYEEGEPCSDCPGDKRCPRVGGGWKLRRTTLPSTSLWKI